MDDPTATQHDFGQTFEESYRFKWAFERIGYNDPASIFTDLSEKYNTVQCRLQDHRAFFLDVDDIAHEATDVHDFHCRMAERQRKRVAELRESYFKTDRRLIRSKCIGHQQSEALRGIRKHKSLDAVVMFINSLLQLDASTELYHQEPHEPQGNDRADAVRSDPTSTPQFKGGKHQGKHHVEQVFTCSDHEIPSQPNAPTPLRQPNNVCFEGRPGPRRKRKADTAFEQPATTGRTAQPRTSRRLSGKPPESAGL